MTRIHIQDLPLDTELTPEELDRLFGAGRPSFRPTIESLEGRELYAANLASSLAPGLLSLANGATDGALVGQQTLRNEALVVGAGATAPAQALRWAAPATPDAALDAALWGGSALGNAATSLGPVARLAGAGRGAAAQTTGQPREWDQDGSHFKETFNTAGDRVLERWYPGAGGRTSYELQVFKKDTGARLVYGREEGGKYVVETWNDKGLKQSTAVYDKAGEGQKLLSRTTRLADDGEVKGEWTRGKWVETTTGSKAFKRQTEEYDGPGGKLLSRDRLENDGKTRTHGERQLQGSWLDTTTGSAAFTERRELSRPDGTLVWREIKFADGRDSFAEWERGKWVERTTGSKDFQARTETYDSPGGKLLARETTFANGVKVTGELKDGQWVERATGVPDQTVTGHILNPDGTVTVTTKDGAKVYKYVGNGWKLIAFNRQTQERWVEEAWGADGTYTKNVWFVKQHGQVGGSDHFIQIVIANGTMTLTRYHISSDYWWGGSRYTANDATLKWVYAVDANGTITSDLYGLHLLTFEVTTSDGYSNHWKKGGVRPEYYNNGWKEWRNDPPPIVQGTWIASLDVRGETVTVPGGLTIEAGAKGGKWVETIWNKEHTQSISFVYSGPDRKELLSQTYGRLNDKGQWVETTTGARDFITRTDTYDKLGGKLVARETTRKAADGRDVTFHGQWKGDKWVETAANYLGFKSVTVEYDQLNGHAVKRYGELRDGRYAVDTFDASGQQVVRRDIFDKQGGTLKETWTGNDSSLTITRYNPTADIAQDELHYGMVGGNFELDRYSARFNKPVRHWFVLPNGRESTQDITEYHWSYHQDENHNDIYREGPSAGSTFYKGEASPVFGFARGFDLSERRFWNKV
jgi:hypothetical protein